MGCVASARRVREGELPSPSFLLARGRYHLRRWDSEFEGDGCSARRALRSRDDRGLVIRQRRPDPAILKAQANCHQGIRGYAAFDEHTRLPSQLHQPQQRLADISVSNNVTLFVAAVQRIRRAAVSWGNAQTATRTDRQASQ